MTFPDLTFVNTARTLEVEAVEGGRALNDFSLDPEVEGDGDDDRVLLRAVDDVEETEERIAAVATFDEYAREAYRQRGLLYPFLPSATKAAFDILPGQEALASKIAELSGISGQGNPVAKRFEARAFRALHKLVGGWGVCVGSPRDGGDGPERAIRRFRELLRPWEVGEEWPSSFSKSGDHGADGFLILGRSWGGPLVYFQSKNSGFDLKNYPEEFARLPEICLDWFGRRPSSERNVIKVLGLNTVMTLQSKDRVARARGDSAVHILDAVDILSTEEGAEPQEAAPTCTCF